MNVKDRCKLTILLSGACRAIGARKGRIRSERTLSLTLRKCGTSKLKIDDDSSALGNSLRIPT